VTFDQWAILGLLGAVMALFVWGRWRHDVVAMGALVVAVALGLVPGGRAFAGFGHPATATIALVLVISRGLANAGAVDAAVRWVMAIAMPAEARIAALVVLAAALSTMMNNVGALALLMPVAIEVAGRAKLGPAAVLMPLSFGSILGGLVTLIGTPPNVIIASYRAEALGTAYGMFDFTPVGAVTALVGLVFLVLAGPRLIPRRQRPRSPRELFDIEHYLGELAVPESAKAVGMTVAELEAASDGEVQIVGLVRRGARRSGAPARLAVAAGDTLMVEAGPEDLDRFAAAFGLALAADETAGEGETVVMEAVVPPRARIEGRRVGAIGFRRHHRVSLLAIARQGRPIRKRLAAAIVRAGDVLLLQGPAEVLPEVMARLGLLPLAERRLAMGRRHLAAVAAAVFAAAIVLATAGWLPIAVALAAAAVVLVVVDAVPLRDLYEAVDWPVVILVGAMIPIGGALQASGVTELAGDALARLAGIAGPALVVVVLLVVTMTLSDVMNNAATAVVAAPVALDAAARMGISPDPMLMAVAVGASCAFLTPIGHQNNLLIMGPGGYRFADYWRLGLPLELLIVVVAVPAILWVWPP